MGGRAKSQIKKKQIDREVSDSLFVRAIALYKAQKDRPKGQRLSLARTCKKITADYFAETKKTVQLAPSTLAALVKGGTPKSQSNAAKGWLLPSEIDTVINYAVEVAARGFPLNHNRLKEHVDEILCARLGNKFPKNGVGPGWTGLFIQRHSARLTRYWSAPLDNIRGQAVNPTTNAAWFDLLGKVLKGERVNTEGEDMREEWEKEAIDDDMIYGVDEAGFWPAGGTKERVIGGTGKTRQHKQGDGGRENTTVIVTICADGTATKPAVIYKGQAFQVKWDQENPAKASCVPLIHSLTCC